LFACEECESKGPLQNPSRAKLSTFPQCLLLIDIFLFKKNRELVVVGDVEKWITLLFPLFWRFCLPHKSAPGADREICREMLFRVAYLWTNGG
jgi:hypothetical protein